ncbi:exopolysaccharide biosynthesis WecB/TagA/CpsF family protein [Rhodoligotrophos appendicifer]|uniref:WecB/TagA/CpsF family glycosyltransferase n=1 Tax=Rhodoligotrophos appendicifer TaxID=987056 RepID=UPI0014783983|nr:WecB/TagA/CpsF family glycosyltransferase [Rhodoligotrophos appendicifer]
MTNSASLSGRVHFLGAPYDLRAVEEVLASLLAVGPEDRFRYVVTPNVDHVTRLTERHDLLPLYESAWQSWCDSHIVRRLGFLVGLRLPHLNGTDVVERIFDEVLRPGDRLAVIAARPDVLEALSTNFPQYDFFGHVPPMGFVNDPQAFSECVEFGAHCGARFLFIAVGAPQSEQVAYAISRAPGATGTAFCIGAAMEFIGGVKTRAPEVMQRLGFEWLHRLLSEPRRLWRRYVLSVGPLAMLFAKEVVRWR